VLVLLTGSLPPEVVPPVEVAVPLPDGATVNAVARIDATDSMLADLEPEIGTDFVTFTLPDQRFRVEYYFPYEQDGLEHSFTFDWLAPALSVRNLSLAVQQPALAVDLETDPDAEAVTQGSDQLDYHNLTDAAVRAGEPYVVDVTYTMSEERLTMSTAEDLSDAEEAVPAEVGETTGLELDWPVVLGVVGGLLILLALGWQLFSDRLAGPGGAPRKPRPARARQQKSANRRQPQGKARFCHNCGERVRPGDRFCRECGTQLKA
jgi:ribosomal protein L32